MHDKDEWVALDRELFLRAAKSPFRLHRKSIREFRSSNRHGFGRRDDRLRLGVFSRRCGAKSYYQRESTVVKKKTNAVEVFIASQMFDARAQQVTCPPNNPMNAVAVLKQQLR
jgi:hypothetical protein